MTEVSQMTRCEFCSAPCPARTYRTADGGTMQVRRYLESGPLLLEHNFTPEREACEPCGKLIDAGDWDGLATRAVQCLTARGIPVREVVKECLQSTYVELKAVGMVRVR